jgi:superfamily II DNA helicase RecQ
MAQTTPLDVLSTDDLLIGSVLAFGLAFLFSFLRSNSDSVLRRELDEAAKVGSKEHYRNEQIEDVDSKVFDAVSWKEMSREENYVVYNTRVRKWLRGENESKSRGSKENLSSTHTEKRAVILALLALFVPIFSAEFFLALSRQILCDTALAQSLCAPHIS